MTAKFRFEDLDIWKEAISIADELLNIADDLESSKKFRFAEQLRGAAMSISNNIAEGSASIFKKEFINYLNFARRSAFENPRFNQQVQQFQNEKPLLGFESLNIFLVFD